MQNVLKEYRELELELEWFIFHRKNVFTLKKKIFVCPLSCQIYVFTFSLKAVRLRFSQLDLSVDLIQSVCCT